MGFADILKFGKKGAKHLPKKKKGGGKADLFTWPAGTRVGVYGHRNAGKTVFYSVLYEDSKHSDNYRISVKDNLTATEFLKHKRKIWGHGVGDGMGTIVHIAEEKAFPDNSTKDAILQFTAIVDGKLKLPITCYDYPGAAIAITDANDYADKVFDFMASCDGLIFLLDPKVLASEIKVQEHISSFVNMIERLAPLNDRLPIPVALVITKADILPGFSGEKHVKLIPEDQEPVVCESYEMFLNQILTDPAISSNSVWAGSVRNVLTSAKAFLQVVLTRTLDFQIFFTSNTGTEPEKIGVEVGHSIYKPPETIKPIGVSEPMHWLSKAIVRRKNISKVRKVKKLVQLASVVWILACSVIFSWHLFVELFPATDHEDKVLNRYTGDAYEVRKSTNKNDRNSISSKYSEYYGNLVMKTFFSQFKPVARSLEVDYKALKDRSLGHEQEGMLTFVVAEFTKVLNNKTKWPTLLPQGEDGKLNYEPKPDSMLVILDSLQRGANATGPMAKRAENISTIWVCFVNCQGSETDNSKWETLRDAATNFATIPGLKGEKALFKRVVSIVAMQMEQKETGEKQVEATSKLDDMISVINSNKDIEYRVETAVDNLKRLRDQLDESDRRSVNNYIRDAKKWNANHKLTLTIKSVPKDCHLHICVETDGKPTWTIPEMLGEGKEKTIYWHPGEFINIALHNDHLDPDDETWGREADGRKILTGSYSIGELDGNITLDNSASVTISVSGIPNLPKLKK